MKKPRRQFVWDGMTVAEWEYARRYIRNAADMLELRDWRTILSEYPAEDRAAGAENRITFGRRRISIALGWDWPKYPRSEKRNHVAHELMHAHWEYVFDLVTSDL